MSLIALATSAFRRGPYDVDAALRMSLARQDKLVRRFVRLLPVVQWLLLLAGLVYLALIPTQRLGRGHYISENALQPGHVNTYWTWADVHVADKYADEIDKWLQEPGATRESFAKRVRSTFTSLGLPVESQTFKFALPSSMYLNGTNVHALLRAPRTDGVEAVVLCAPLLSRIKDSEGAPMVNKRGIAILLALANYFKKQSYWSKDIIFAVTDSSYEGLQAWLDAYHGFGQSNLVADALTLTTGPIWAAVNIDYPYHSFSHVGMFYQGSNAHMANLDLVNSASDILKGMGIPVVLREDASEPAPWLTKWYDDNESTRRYERHARNVWREIKQQAVGKAEGPEGVYGKYRIDAITLLGVPAEGPHGFHTLGRSIESLLRSINNLLERFHQSFFLYLMTSVESFVSVGNYLAAPILVGASLTIRGLRIWSTVSKRHLEKPLLILATCFAVGLVSMHTVSHWKTTDDFLSLGTTLTISYMTVPQLASLAFEDDKDDTTQRSIIQSFTLIGSGIVISALSTLNFGFATFSAFLLALVSLSDALRLPRSLVPLFEPACLWTAWRLADKTAANEWLAQVVREWHVVGSSINLAYLHFLMVPLVLAHAFC